MALARMFELLAYHIQDTILMSSRCKLIGKTGLTKQETRSQY